MQERFRESRKSIKKWRLYRGIQLFNENLLDEAKEHFDIAINDPRDSKISARAIFWKAEADYLLTNYEEARVGFKQFENANDTNGLLEKQQLYYSLGYTHFKLKLYDLANINFKGYLISSPKDNPTKLVIPRYD